MGRGEERATGLAHSTERATGPAHSTALPSLLHHIAPSLVQDMARWLHGCAWLASPLLFASPLGQDMPRCQHVCACLDVNKACNRETSRNVCN